MPDVPDIPMHPRPRAETDGPPFPSLRVCMAPVVSGDGETCRGGAGREATTPLFDGFNLYIGGFVGELLGELLTHTSTAFITGRPRGRPTRLRPRTRRTSQSPA
jgi:hypothetical protein